MKKIDVQARLEYARAGVAVLRGLQILDQTMRYKQFAIAIGLIADGENWEPWHRQQVADILNIIAATERSAGNSETAPLELVRIVTASGEPGAGFKKASRIVKR